MTSPEESPFLKRMKRRPGNGPSGPPRVPAHDAAGTFLFLQKELMLLETRLRALGQLRRLIWGIAGIVLLTAGLALSTFWFTQWLHETGWSTGKIASLSFVLFGILSTTSFAVCLGRWRR